jgi:hypothetical protein
MHTEYSARELRVKLKFKYWSRCQYVFTTEGAEEHRGDIFIFSVYLSVLCGLFFYHRGCGGAQRRYFHLLRVSQCSLWFIFLP